MASCFGNDNTWLAEGNTNQGGGEGSVRDEIASSKSEEQIMTRRAHTIYLPREVGSGKKFKGAKKREGERRAGDTER
jgi:hypothetical protein